MDNNVKEYNENDYIKSGTKCISKNFGECKIIGHRLIYKTAEYYIISKFGIIRRVPISDIEVIK